MSYESNYCNVSGYLDPSTESEHINAGTKLELAFWLAHAVCSRRKHTVSIELPKHYREVYRHILTADANVVDLHKMGPFFYVFGTQLLNFEHQDSADIAKSMLQVFYLFVMGDFNLRIDSSSSDARQLSGMF